MTTQPLSALTMLLSRHTRRRALVWRMQSLMGAHGFAEALTRAFLYLLPGRTRALEERRRSARGIWLEATHAINAHRSDRSGGNVARPSRQPSHSNAVVRGHE